MRKSLRRGPPSPSVNFNTAIGIFEGSSEIGGPLLSASASSVALENSAGKVQ